MLEILLRSKSLLHGVFTMFSIFVFRDITTGANIQHEHENNFEINGYYLDDVLNYSPAEENLNLDE